MISALPASWNKGVVQVHRPVLASNVGIELFRQFTQADAVSKLADFTGVGGVAFLSDDPVVLILVAPKNSEVIQTLATARDT